MGKETRLFKSEERKNRKEVAEFLRQISEKLSNGQIVLRRGNEELNLEIPTNLVLEIQVEDEDKKAKGIQHSRQENHGDEDKCMGYLGKGWVDLEPDDQKNNDDIIWKPAPNSLIPGNRFISLQQAGWRRRRFGIPPGKVQLSQANSTPHQT